MQQGFTLSRRSPASPRRIRPEMGLRAETERSLRDIAYVLHLTQKVKDSIENNPRRTEVSAN